MANGKPIKRHDSSSSAKTPNVAEQGGGCGSNIPQKQAYAEFAEIQFNSYKNLFSKKRY